MTGSMEAARAIVQQLIPHSIVNSYHDTVTALAGASSAQPGVVVIAGTGSIAYGRLADGREAQAGGWGYMMGDEGSGYDIGREALRAATQAQDGRSAFTDYSKRFPAYFQARDLFGFTAQSIPGRSRDPDRWLGCSGGSRSGSGVTRFLETCSVEQEANWL
jgi:N-acetylglucosamine kinase-like BadF-type ATPase